jgi:hypothetical protein
MHHYEFTMKDQKKLLKPKFRVPIYLCDITVVYVKDMYSVRDKYNLTKDECESYSAFVNGETQSYTLVTMTTRGDILAHELIHVISLLYKDYGIDYDKNNDEPTAYLMSFLFKSVMKRLKQQKRLNKTNHG